MAPKPGTNASREEVVNPLHSPRDGAAQYIMMQEGEDIRNPERVLPPPVSPLPGLSDNELSPAQSPSRVPLMAQTGPRLRSNSRYTGAAAAAPPAAPPLASVGEQASLRGNGLAGRGSLQLKASSPSSRMMAARIGSMMELPADPVSPRLQWVLLAPALVYTLIIVLWMALDIDIEYAREIGPISFAALCMHLFCRGEHTAPNRLEAAHYWLHAGCEVLAANDFTVTLGGGPSGVAATSALMLVFWPSGWACLRLLRRKLNHPSRIQRLGSVAEAAVRGGVPLMVASLYLGAQSLSCMVSRALQWQRQRRGGGSGNAVTCDLKRSAA
jgi:hypothetical protein